MARRPIFRTLMAGVAVASLSTVAMADGWTSFIVFGDRNHDSGQYVSHEALFNEDGDDVGDGRDRATNIVAGGGRGLVISQIVADHLGFAQPNPSQPVTAAGVPTPPDGFNYAASFSNSARVLSSINDVAVSSGVRYSDANGDVTHVPGRTRDGLLVDPERQGRVRGALVLMNGGTTDLRYTADVDRELNGDVDLDRTWIVTNAADRDYFARQAADNIATGAEQLSRAGAGLVVVTNSYDVGAIPEVGGDNELLDDADRALIVRETEAQRAEDAAERAADARDIADQIAAGAAQRRDTIHTSLHNAESDPSPNAALIQALRSQLVTATTIADNAIEDAEERNAAAQEARAEADAVALTRREIALRTQIDAAIADPDLIGTIRTAATDVYNERLSQQLRSVDGNIVVVDQRALFDEIIANPARFGLAAEDVDHAVDCLDSSTLYPCNQVSGRVSERLFMNGIELTTTGHRLAADQIKALVSAPAVLSGATGIGLSSGRSIADASRDQLSREQSWRSGVSVFVTGGTSRVKLSDNNGFGQSDGAFHSGVVGAKYVLGNGIAVGAAGSYQLVKTPGSESTMHYDGDAMLGTVFAGINTGPVFGSVTGTYGKINYDDLSRISKIGPARILNGSDTEGTVAGVTAEAGVRLVQYDMLRAGPIANFSHWSSKIDGYSESGWEPTAVRVGDIETKSTRAGVGLFMEAGGIVDGFGTLFRAKALYGHEFQDDVQTASVTPLGGSSVGSFSTDIRGADRAPFELGGEVVFGYNGIITTFGYDGIFGDISDHRFRLGASVPLGG